MKITKRNNIHLDSLFDSYSDNLDHHPAYSYHIDLLHGDSALMSMSCLQAKVSECPCGEPC